MVTTRAIRAGRRAIGWHRSHPRRLLRAGEVLIWSGLARVLVGMQPIERAVYWLDLLPRRRPGSRAVALPPERPFRLAGACLGRSLARSQYLRMRGQPSALIIGVRGGLSAFAAHAWLEGDPVDPDFVEIRRIHR
jgi:hypothetical protein